MTCLTPDSFLEQAGWHGATKEAIAGDSSARQYQRLTLGSKTAVLMMAPPEETKAFRQFIRVANWLGDIGLSAPEILAADADAGLMLIEDFGVGVMAQLATEPSMERTMYVATAKVLGHLSKQPPLTELPVLDASALSDQTGLLFEEMDDRPSPAIQEDWQSKLNAVLSANLPDPSVAAMRDLHAENIMWLPDRPGLARVALLDFQDAVVAAPGYDLASLVDDPRRIVPDHLRADLIAAHAADLGRDKEDLAQQVDLLSLARNLRILGIFRRVARLRERASYLAFLPRTAQLIRQAAHTPAAAPLGPQIAWVLASYGFPEGAA